MNELLRPELVNKVFNEEEFNLFAQAVPYAMMVINWSGTVIFANENFQDICFAKKTTITPFLSYHELIDPLQTDLIGLVTDTFTYRRDISRQIFQEKKSYLIESKAVEENEVFIGCAISITDVTQSVLKEKQHELLYQMSSALSGATSLNQVLKVGMTQIMRSMGVSAANIMLLNESTNTLSIKIDSKSNSPHTSSREFELGEGLAGQCARDSRPFSSNNIAEDAQFTQRRDDDTGALLVVPITSRGRVLGVVNVADDQPRYFTESEVQFLTIVANDIAIALENSLLYERLNHKVKQLSKLFLTSSFIGIKTLDSRIQRIVKIIAELLEVEDCCIYIHSTARNKLVLKYQKDIASPLPLQIDLEKPSLSRNVLYDQETQVLNDVQKTSSPTIFKRYPKINNVMCSPIQVNQRPIGVLHVINKVSGNFDEEDRHLLTITAHRIGTIIENAQLIRKVGAEKDLLDKIIQNTSEGVAVLNRKRRIIIWNHYLEELTGLQANEVIGLPCYKILYSRLGLKKLTQELYAPFKDNKGDKNPRIIEEMIKNHHNDKIWLGSVYSHLFDQTKNVENTIIVFRNISKDKEFIEAKNEFVSLTTHELRTPLTAIKGYLSMILKGDSGDVTPKQREYFNKAYLATERLVGLVEELLDVVRIDENRIKFTITTFPINQIIEESIQDFTNKAQGKGLSIAYQAGLPVYVKADPDKTKQIISNLLDNAIKYTKDKGTIKVFIEKQERDALIRVQDNGVGIPTKYLTAIFERFVRAPNSLSIKAGGTGLGLYIVKNLVERQGGKIWATSQIGKETTFHVTLPLAKNPSLQPLLEEES